MDSVYAASKEKEKEKEKDKEDKDKEKDKEREREMEMEAALYTNCLLLGLDASVLGQGGIPRSGLFRHSNPRMGENLLHFLLSALRGPAQSAKDFAGVWPIFDAGQSRDFRKIVQNLINELEAQGALPRSNSRVSSLATCCGQRFVELLWQLSSHALREVHKRSFPGDVSSNPLPPSLTEVVAQSNHASALLTVTKARIAMERRRFLDSATAAVHRQALWSSLAHDMTAEYRALCAEEAYLHQELEKLQDSRSQKEGLIRDWQNGSEEQKSLSVSRASLLWESLINQTAQHEKLASGPIEDLIAHREHRYRVSGPALRAAMERGSSASLNELSSYSTEESSASLRSNQINTSVLKSNFGLIRSNGESAVAGSGFEIQEESRAKSDERATKGSAPLDVAEILRRWTHSLQCIHKQALRLARTNDGTGPDLIKETSDDKDNGHAQALRAALSEHKQHLANIQILIGQLKESMPGMEASIATLREQLSRTVPHMVSASTSTSVSDRLVPLREASPGQGAEVATRTGTSHLELVPPSPALKLPQIFSLSPTAMGRSSQSQKSRAPSQRGRVFVELSNEDSSAGQAFVQSTIEVDLEGKRDDSLASLRRAVHDAALSTNTNLAEETKLEGSEHGTEHFFTPVVSGNSHEEGLDATGVNNCLQKFPDRSSQEYHRYNGKPLVNTLEDRGETHRFDKEVVTPKQGKASKPVKCLNYNGLTPNGTSLSSPEMLQVSSCSESIAGELARPFSPPLLTELSSFSDTFDDLLGAEDFELSDVALQGVWFNPTM